MKCHVVIHGQPAKGGSSPSLWAQFKSKIKSLHYTGLASGKEGQEVNRTVHRKYFSFNVLSSGSRVTLSVWKTTAGISLVAFNQQLMVLSQHFETQEENVSPVQDT